MDMLVSQNIFYNILFKLIHQQSPKQFFNYTAFIVGASASQRLCQIDQKRTRLRSHNARLVTVEQHIEGDVPYARLVGEQFNAPIWNVYQQRNETKTNRSNLITMFFFNYTERKIFVVVEKENFT